MKGNLLLICLFLILSCSVKNQKADNLYESKVQILGDCITEQDIREKDVCLYSLNRSKGIKLEVVEAWRSYRSYRYHQYGLMNTQDGIIAEGYPIYSYHSQGKSGIFKFNFNGELMENLYDVPSRHGIYQMELSPGDNKLLYIFDLVTEEDPMPDTPGLGNVSVVDLETKDTCIYQIALGYNVTISSSPWSPEADKFVYHINRKWQYNDTILYDWTPVLEPGLYIYDFREKTNRLIAKNGWDGVWSPTGKYIAYFLEDAIHLYNTENGQDKIFYKRKFTECIDVFCWEKNGEYLLIDCPWFCIEPRLFGIANQRLINIETNKEVPMKNRISVPSIVYDCR
ncbi:MAG: hypothetical protein AB2L24_03785 [Mangrovibacterium sp.]